MADIKLAPGISAAIGVGVSAGTGGITINPGSLINPSDGTLLNGSLKFGNGDIYLNGNFFGYNGGISLTTGRTWGSGPSPKGVPLPGQGSAESPGIDAGGDAGGGADIGGGEPAGGAVE